MPVKNPQICGKSFKADYIKEGEQWKCELTSNENLSKPGTNSQEKIMVDGFGASKEAALQEAKVEVEKILSPKKD